MVIRIQSMRRPSILSSVARFLLVFTPPPPLFLLLLLAIPVLLRSSPSNQKKGKETESCRARGKGEGGRGLPEVLAQMEYFFLAFSPGLVPLFDTNFIADLEAGVMFVCLL
jgi:hypothetical protein